MKSKLLPSNLKKGSIVEVTWEDAYGCPKWGNTDEEIPSLIVKNIGYVVQVNDAGLGIAGGFQVEDPKSINALHFIPVGMIRKVRVIRG